MIVHISLITHSLVNVTELRSGRVERAAGERFGAPQRPVHRRRLEVLQVLLQAVGLEEHLQLRDIVSLQLQAGALGSMRGCRGRGNLELGLGRVPAHQRQPGQDVLPRHLAVLLHVEQPGDLRRDKAMGDAGGGRQPTQRWLYVKRGERQLMGGR